MYARRAAEQLAIDLAEAPVVLLNGARQTGKTTLVQKLAEQPGGLSYVTLDEAGYLDAARRDAQGFVFGFPGRVAIDEVQRAPDLFRAIKLSVDKDRRPGRFLLTGSAQVLLLPSLSESLAGRMTVVTLWPLSQGEIDGGREGFIDALFSEAPPSLTSAAESRSELVSRIVRGGFPEMVARADPEARRRWAEAYLTTVVERDVPDIADVSDRLALPRLLRVLAARSSALLNLSELSRTTGIKRTTIDRYFAVLTIAFLVRALPSWAGNIGRRPLKSPKTMLADTGLLCSLLGLDEQRLLDEPYLLGPILENFVAAELTKQIEWSRTRAQLMHYRTAREEVDLVIEDARGRVVGVEVKATSSPSGDDFSGLRGLAEALGPKFHRGVVLHAGPSAVPFGNNMWALPVESLWRFEAPSG